ncbi:MAG TPA: hypothetical protein VK501_14790 [Baekduia sp.]|uniref:hypothetical protein n=1 Tax=Baekduia sp. TaxID=2600305 RepID=UPI002BF6BD81|nr:hypothetical protein [Baekduia sp.]HMJ35175.1 hypothetical protein [Baekduia sp.]
MGTSKRPYRGMRGDFVLEQRDPSSDLWTVVVGGSAEKLRKERARYPGDLRITPNGRGAALREGSYRP